MVTSAMQNVTNLSTSDLGPRGQTLARFMSLPDNETSTVSTDSANVTVKDSNDTAHGLKKAARSRLPNNHSLGENTLSNDSLNDGFQDSLGSLNRTSAGNSSDAKAITVNTTSSNSSRFESQTSSKSTQKKLNDLSVNPSDFKQNEMNASSTPFDAPYSKNISANDQNVLPDPLANGSSDPGSQSSTTNLPIQQQDETEHDDTLQGTNTVTCNNQYRVDRIKEYCKTHPEMLARNDLRYVYQVGSRMSAILLFCHQHSHQVLYM